jgi:hypothetical protein
MKVFPHSRHAAFDRGVINPQAGHILCVAYPAICGLNRRIRKNKTRAIAKITASNPPLIPIAFIHWTSLES